MVKYYCGWYLFVNIVEEGEGGKCFSVNHFLGESSASIIDKLHWHMIHSHLVIERENRIFRGLDLGRGTHKAMRKKSPRDQSSPSIGLFPM